MRKEGQSRESYELEYYERTGGGETADQIIKTLGPEISAIKGKVSFNRKRQRFMWACMVMNTVLLFVIIVFLGILTLILNNSNNKSTKTITEAGTNSGYGPCTMELNGEAFTFLMLTDTSKTHQITMNTSCELRFLAVGGGGKCTTRGAGAGSGYLRYHTIKVNSGTIINMVVGRQRQPSTVSIANAGTYQANPGQDCQGDDGGAGYSGGGGDASSEAGAAYGGNNGGDGQDGNTGAGGAGTGENISSYTFTSWAISPGAGGKHSPGSGWFGGGGGGILVDMEGPQASTYEGEYLQGQGYGGGGNGWDSYGSGLQGVILIEITSV